MSSIIPQRGVVSEKLMQHGGEVAVGNGGEGGEDVQEDRRRSPTARPRRNQADRFEKDEVVGTQPALHEALLPVVDKRRQVHRKPAVDALMTTL